MNEAISAAYGYDGIGVLAVKNVPKMKDFREKLLPMAFKFANLPESVQRKYEHPSSHYSFGILHYDIRFYYQDGLEGRK